MPCLTESPLYAIHLLEVWLQSVQYKLCASKEDKMSAGQFASPNSIIIRMIAGISISIIRYMETLAVGRD